MDAHAVVIIILATTFEGKFVAFPSPQPSFVKGDLYVDLD
jgi:hypothetical protein